MLVKSPTSIYSHQNQSIATPHQNGAPTVQNRSTSVSTSLINGQVLTKPRVSPNLRTKNRHMIQGYSIIEERDEFPKCVVVHKSPPYQQHSANACTATTKLASRPIHSQFSSSQPSLNAEDRLRRHSYSPATHAARTGRGGFRGRNRFSFAGVEKTHQNGRKMEQYLPNAYNVTLTKLSLEDLRPQPIAVPVPMVPKHSQRFSTSYIEDEEEDIDGTLVSTQAQHLSSQRMKDAILTSDNLRPVKVLLPKVPTNRTNWATNSQAEKNAQTEICSRNGGSAVSNRTQGTAYNGILQEENQKARSNGVRPVYVVNGMDQSQVLQHVYQTTSNGQHSIDRTNEPHCHTAHCLKTNDIIQHTPTQKHFLVQNQQQQQQNVSINNNNNTVSGNHLQQSLSNGQWQNGVQNDHQMYYCNQVNDINGEAVNGCAFEPIISPTDPRAIGSYSCPNTPSDLIQTNYLFHQHSLTSSTSQVNPAVEYNTGSHVQYPSYPSVKLSNSQVRTGLLYSNQSMSLDELRDTNITALSMAASNSLSRPTSQVSSCSSCQTQHTPTPNQLDEQSCKDSDCSSISRSVSISPFSPAGTESNNGPPSFGVTQSEGTLLQTQSLTLPPTTSLQHCPISYMQDDNPHVHNGVTVQVKSDSPSKMKGQSSQSMSSAKDGSDHNNMSRQRSSTLPASYRKSPKHERSSTHIMQRSSSLRDILEVDETDHEVSRAEIKLSDYLDLNANRLPQKVKICKGFCSHSSEVTLSRGEVFNFHFVKHTKVITICDMYSTAYDVPLNSTIKFGVVYNPFNVKTVSATHTLGFQFKSAKEIMYLKHLPTVVSVTNGYQGSSPESSVKEGEILIVQGVKTRDNESILKVVSRNSYKTKFLTENCDAHFTTSTLRTQLTVEEMFRLSVPCPQKAMMFPSDGMSDKIPTHMQTTVVTLMHFSVVKSVIATPVILYNAARPPQPIEIVSDLETDVQEVVDVSENKWADMLIQTQSLYDSFDPLKIQLYKDTPNSQAYNVQTVLWSSLNVRQKMRGMQLLVPDVISANNQKQGIFSQPSSERTGEDNISKSQTSPSQHFIKSSQTRFGQVQNAPSVPASKFELEIRLKAVEFHSHRMDEEVVKLSRSLSDVSQQVTQIKSMVEGSKRPIKDNTNASISSVHRAQVAQQEIPTGNVHDRYTILKEHKERKVSLGDKSAYLKHPEPKKPSPVHSSKKSLTNARTEVVQVAHQKVLPTSTLCSIKPLVSNNDKLTKAEHQSTRNKETFPSQVTKQTSPSHASCKQQNTTRQFNNRTEQQQLSSLVSLPGSIKTGSPKRQQRPSDKPTIAPKPAVAPKPPVARKPIQFQCGSHGSQGHIVQPVQIEIKSVYESPPHTCNINALSKDQQVPVIKEGRPANNVGKEQEQEYCDTSPKSKTHVQQPVALLVDSSNNIATKTSDSIKVTKSLSASHPHTQNQLQNINTPLPSEDKSSLLLNEDFVDSADESDIDAIVNDLTLFCSQIEDELSKYPNQAASDGPTLV